MDKKPQDPKTCTHKNLKTEESEANTETGYEILECLDCGQVFEITYY